MGLKGSLDLATNSVCPPMYIYLCVLRSISIYADPKQPEDMQGYDYKVVSHKKVVIQEFGTR